MTTKMFRCGIATKAQFLVYALTAFVAVPSQARADLLSDNIAKLSQKELTFLRIVYGGDEAKAVEYAEVAGINVNSIAGEPLSAWFYDTEDVKHRDVRVQRIVFGRFKQNPNPRLRDFNGIRNYCSYAPFPQNIPIQTSGTPEQKKDLQAQQFAAQKRHIDAMIEGYEFLRQYGLKDRGILSAMLPNCVFTSPGPASEYIYDNLVAKLVKDGGDINASNPSSRRFGRVGRPIERAVSDENDAIVERLLRDGVQTQFPISVICEDKVTNLYGYIIGRSKPANPERLARIVGMLNAAGLPASKPVTAPNGYGFTYCRRTTLYDEAVNAGNLDFAKAIKAAIESTKPITRAPAALLPAPSSAPVALAGEKVPDKIGAWQIKTDNGRLVATAKASNLNNTSKDLNNGFAALRLECTAGKLEFVPVALKLGVMTSLWIESADDIINEFRLVDQRLSGASATALANDVAVSEAIYKRNGTAEWGTGMNVESSNAAMDQVVMTGFSEMRAFMRANCKR